MLAWELAARARAFERGASHINDHLVRLRAAALALTPDCGIREAQGGPFRRCQKSFRSLRRRVVGSQSKDLIRAEHFIHRSPSGYFTQEIDVLHLAKKPSTFPGLQTHRGRLHSVLQRPHHRIQEEVPRATATICQRIALLADDVGSPLPLLPALQTYLFACRRRAALASVSCLFLLSSADRFPPHDQ